MAANPNAVTVAAPSVPVALDQGVTYNLDAFPDDRFLRLIPTQTIRMPSDLIVPVIQVVQLDPSLTGPDVYTNNDIGAGKAALTRVALRKVATAAAISILDSRRTDDGTKPGTCEMTVTAEMVLPTGQRIRAVGVKRIVMDDQHWASDNQRKKYQGFLQEHTAARAENRAIRALLSLRPSYPVAELRKPFAVVTFAPNMNHPEVRARILDAMAPAVSAIYGPEPAKAVGPGTEPIQQLAPAPDDDDQDDIADAAYREVATNGRATVDMATGEIVASTEEPSWFGEATSTKPGLAARLRAVADANAPLTGPATQEQKEKLKALLRPLGAEAVGAVLLSALDVAMTAIQVRHAQAVLEVATAMGAEAFLADWRAAAEQLAGAR